MNVNIISVTRNTFKSSDDKEVKYCKFTCIRPGKETENFSGYVVESYTTSFDNYDLLVPFIKNGKPVSLEFEYTRMTNGYYRAKPIKIGETDL